MLCGDALSLPLRSGIAQCVVTSPPYLGQRVYGGKPGEIGQESTVDSYCETMVRAAGEIRRVLLKTGVLWLNLGDKSNGSGGAGGDYNVGGGKQGQPRYGKFLDRRYLKGQFLCVPHKVVAALQDDGWRLRQTIVWDKAQQTREDLVHINRPRTQHEYIFMLQPGPGRTKFYPDRLKDTGTIWRFPPAQSEGKGHLAPFPNELARRCILLSTDPGDLVVDPFSGSNTTVNVSHTYGRRAVGVDLYARR